MVNMLPRDRAEKILTLGKAGWSADTLAQQLGHSPTTIRDYLNGRKTPGVPAPRMHLLTDALADYSRQRLAEDPHLRPNALFKELKELGFQASRATFYRELRHHRLLTSTDRRPHPHQDLLADLAGRSRATIHPIKHEPVLPRPVAPITGESLSSYLSRLARTNHLTLAEVLAVLPSWFSTKINNPDELSQHHMLAPATTDALSALARLGRTTPQHLAGALPAFGARHTRGPVRATTACRCCTARRGITEPVPVHLPVHLKVCTRHGIWLSDTGQPNLDVTACPEIIAAQYRANRLLRRYTPQQLVLAHETALAAIPLWPAASAAIPLHWRHRLLTLQTINHNRHHDIGTDHDAYTRAAKYPDAIALVPAILSTRRIEQDLLAKSPRHSASRPC
ncbi:TniQ family protein [Nocardia sp. NPDC101769]|uniref:TniQ family protein n=1 Tax=Nocardia sp. NPDC101769 TaxID=3364333 RepID=UPI00382C07B5